MADQDSQTEDRINLRAVGYAVRFQSSVSVVGAVEEETDAEIQIRCATTQQNHPHPFKTITRSNF